MPTAPPPDPYPPLGAVLRQLQTDAELWLPARLAHGRPGPLWRGEQAPLWQVVLFALGAVLAFRQVWALTVALAVAALAAGAAALPGRRADRSACIR